MALIKQVKQVKKVTISIHVSKDLADKFNFELDKYNKSNQSNSILDFDPLVKKLVDELTKINTDSGVNDESVTDKI